MNAEVVELRDIVHVHVTADLPIRAQALPFADRVEIRFGKAFPVVLIVDRLALDRLSDAVESGRLELELADEQKKGSEG